MRGTRVKELRRLAHAAPAGRGQIPEATILAGDKSAVIIKGATRRAVFKALKTNYRKISTAKKT